MEICTIEVQGTMSEEAEEAISQGLFPGAILKDTFHGDSGFRLRKKTNIFLEDGEEFVSPIDGKTVLVGKFVTVHNSLNGYMRHTHLSVKG